MSAGPFGPGGCSDADLVPVTDAIMSPSNPFNPEAFVNPQAAFILNMTSTTGATNAGLALFQTSVLALPLLDPTRADKLLQCGQLAANLGTMTQAMGQFTSYTNFLSGRSANFPALDAALLFGGTPPPGLAVMGAIGFVGMLGMLGGANKVAHATCKVDKSSPCAGVNAVMGIITGAYNKLLEAIQNGLALMTDFANKIGEYIKFITEAVATLVKIISDSVTALVSLVLSAIQYGLAQLLKGLTDDPCVKAVLQVISGPELKTALSL